jgi:hypothetical protein
MSKDVFANGKEISGKATRNKSIAALPDVCLSPPAPPTGPIPIPYPNTAMASQTAAGSRGVKIRKREVGLKNKSVYKKSTGNEPATRNFGMGVISHKITGPMKFAAWSMDVQIEGANVTRFMDLTTHNHVNAHNAASCTSIAGLSVPIEDAGCEELSQANKSARDDMKTGDHGKGVRDFGAGNNVITHARFDPSGGTPELWRGANNAVVHRHDSSFASGLTSAEAEKQRASGEKGGKTGEVKSSACDGTHIYPRGYFMPHESHAEARVIEDIFKKNKWDGENKIGTLTLAIDWPGGPAAGLTTASPCVNCEALICAVLKCMDIIICDEHNNPQNAEDLCNKEKEQQQALEKNKLPKKKPGKNSK